MNEYDFIHGVIGDLCEQSPLKRFENVLLETPGLSEEVLGYLMRYAERRGTAGAYRVLLTIKEDGYCKTLPFPTFDDFTEVVR